MVIGKLSNVAYWNEKANYGLSRVFQEILIHKTMIRTKVVASDCDACSASSDCNTCSGGECGGCDSCGAD